VQQNSGYSLLELLVALSISTILTSALLLSLSHVQVLAHDMTLQTDRDANFRLVPLLLVQWIAAAGNNRWNADWEGVSIVDGTSYFKSDFDGSGGFPDDQLSSSYENIALCHRGGNLTIQSGGGFFQPVVRRISRFESERQEEDLVLLTWWGETDHPLKTTGDLAVTEAEMKIHLWNYRQNLFLEKFQ